jgi:anaerobic magnesium-protoporphyrin IX monomethyl ester cyclase
MVSLYSYRNFPVRGLVPLARNIEGVDACAVFLEAQPWGKINLPTPKEVSLFEGILREYKPDVVGISVLTPFALVARKVSAMVRKNTSALVLWGGIHVTLCPEDCINDADVLCVGEGYGAMTDLLERITAGRPYDDVPNLWVRKDGGIVKNPMRPLIQDLDSLPFTLYGDPEFYFIHGNKLTRDDPVLIHPTLHILTSRGCPYKCTYCINNSLREKYKGLGRYIRRRGVDSVIRELLEFLAKSKGATKDLFFNDEVFTTNKEWLEEFQVRYKEEIGLPFNLELYPSLVNPQLLEPLVRAGLRTVVTGIQTGTDHVRNEIFRRPITNEDILKAAGHLESIHVKQHFDYILNNPYETADCLRQTLELMLKLPKPLSFALFSLQFFPGLVLTQKAIEDGHVTQADMTPEKLFKGTEKSMMFYPKLFPLNARQMLMNVVWLYARNRAPDKAVRYAASGKSAAANLFLFYIGIKAFAIGKISYIVTGNRFLLRLRAAFKR